MDLFENPYKAERTRTMISKRIYEEWKDQPILHDEDMWNGKYKTYSEMWTGEGYTIESEDKE